MSVQSVHIWGFFDDDGHPRRPDGAAPSDLSVYHHHRQLERNLIKHGGNVCNLRTTRTLDGFLVATEFDAPAHHATAAFWHQVVQPHAEWGQQPAAHPDPEEPAMPEHESATEGGA